MVILKNKIIMGVRTCGYIRDMRTNNGNILQLWDFGNLIS